MASPIRKAKKSMMTKIRKEAKSGTKMTKEGGGHSAVKVAKRHAAMDRKFARKMSK
jgi:hypothetical protein